MASANRCREMTERLLKKWGNKCTIVKKTEQSYNEITNTYEYETSEIETFYITKSDKVLLLSLNKVMTDSVTISEGKEQIVVLARDITIQDEVVFNGLSHSILDVKNIKYKDEIIIQILTITKI